MFRSILGAFLGDRNVGYQSTHRCPFMLCPSNIHLMHPDKEDGWEKPPRMKFIEKIQPTVYQYRCKDCGCLNNLSVEIDKQGNESYVVNPALIGGRPSYRTNWRI